MSLRFRLFFCLSFPRIWCRVICRVAVVQPFAVKTALIVSPGWIARAARLLLRVEQRGYLPMPFAGVTLARGLAKHGPLAIGYSTVRLEKAM